MKTENIFENVEFGTRYLCRDGNAVIFKRMTVGGDYTVITPEYGDDYYVSPSGLVNSNRISDKDIVSEIIDKKPDEETALKYIRNIIDNSDNRAERTLEILMKIVGPEKMKK